MKSSTLPLTSPCSGTKRKTTVPLFFASTGGLRLLSFMPILHHSLHHLFFYSPSLRRGSVGAGGLRLLSFIPILHHSLQLFDFYSSSLCRGSVGCYGGLRLLSFTPILHHSLQLFDFYSLSLRRFASSGGLRWLHILSYIVASLFFLLFFSSCRCCLRVCASMVGLMVYILYKNIFIYTEFLYKSYKIHVKKSSKTA